MAFCLILAGLSPAGASTLDTAAVMSGHAVRAASQGKWSHAGRYASKAGDGLAMRLVTWLYIQQGGSASYSYLSQFVLGNPHWPGMDRLIRKTEIAMPQDLPPAQVIGWFAQYPPRSISGAIKYIYALNRVQGRAAAREFARDYWVNNNFSDAELVHFYNAVGALLTKTDHNARIDRLIWDNRLTQGERQMLPLLGPDHAALSRARIALLRGQANVDDLIAAVPESLRQHPGLIYARLKWRRSKNMDRRAIQMLSGELPKDLIRPELWWKERHILARRLMEQGQFKRAYQLVSRHRQNPGGKSAMGFAQAEWLSGWLALRFLDRPWDAFGHFEKMYYGVKTPISKARAAYWGGRAAEALGQKDVAAAWYGDASRFVTTFYGQLALARLGLKPTEELRSPAEPTRSDVAAFDNHDLVRAVRLLHAGGVDNYVDDFLMAISKQIQTPAGHVLAARLAREVGQQKMAIKLAKNAARDELVLFDEGYPVLYPMPVHEPDPALIHAMIRQESAFDAQAVSTAGARGLMQLMPATAREVASRIGAGGGNVAALNNPRHNIRLGSAYLGQLIDQYNGSYVLAVAAYNAGPGRVSRWIKEIGDPRSGKIDIVDWIERIPVYETRNYVQRVMEGFYIYSYLLRSGY